MAPPRNATAAPRSVPWSPPRPCARWRARRCSCRCSRSAPDRTAPTAKPPAVAQPRAKPRTTNSTTPTIEDRGVLAVQVGLGAGLDGRGDLLHARVAGRQTQDRRHREHAVENGEQRRRQSQPTATMRDPSGFLPRSTSCSSVAVKFARKSLERARPPKKAAHYITPGEPRHGRPEPHLCSELEFGLELRAAPATPLMRT